MIKDQVKPQTETEALFQLNKPTLHALSYALRHPDTWPKDFTWNYKYCDECAMGLASQLWNIILSNAEDVDDESHENISNMAKTFAMPYDNAQQIFYDANHNQSMILGLSFPCAMTAVTPEMVADKIDKYLATVK